MGAPKHNKRKEAISQTYKNLLYSIESLLFLSVQKVHMRASGATSQALRLLLLLLKVQVNITYLTVPGITH